MRMLSRFEWTLSCATVVALIGLATPALADTACTGKATNTIVKGKLIVPPGASCILTSVLVAGDIQVQAGASALTLNSTQVSGNIDSQDAAITLTNGAGGRFYAPDLTTIGGALKMAGGTLYIEGAFIRGDLVVNGADFVVIGGATIGGNANIQNLTGVSADFGTNFMCASIVSQSFQLTKSDPGAPFLLGESPALSCFGNTIHDNVVVKDNDAGVTLTNNAVAGALQCDGNRFKPDGGGNRVGGPKSGQCAGL